MLLVDAIELAVFLFLIYAITEGERRSIEELLKKTLGHQISV